MFRRTMVYALTGTVLMATGLSACGSDDDSSSSSGSAGTVSSDKPSGNLTIWAQAEQAAALPTFTKQFEKENPGVHITVTALPWDAAHNKYQTAIAGGSTPDIAQMGTTWMADFADAFATAPSNIDTKGFFPGSVESTKVDGQAKGVPWYVDTRMFYYRKDMLKKAGYSKWPTTDADFQAMTKAMQSKAGAKWGLGLPASGADSFQSMAMFPWSAGAKLMNDDKSKWTFDTPQMVKALTYYQSFFKQKIANANPDTGAGAAESAFVKGTTPILIAGPSGIGSIAKAGGGDSYKSRFGVGRVPKDVSQTSFVGGSHLVVFNKSKNQNTAWKFIQYMTTPKVQVQWHQKVGDLPALQSAWKDKSLANDPHLSEFGEQLKTTDSPPAVQTWTQVSAEADKMLERVVKQGADPATELKALQAKADSIGTGD